MLHSKFFLYFEKLGLVENGVVKVCMFVTDQI
jgi:hypothetical protein